MDYEETVSTVQAYIANARKQVLDSMEFAFGSHPHWPFARSRILRAFGRQGLGGVFKCLEQQKEERNPNQCTSTSSMVSSASQASVANEVAPTQGLLRPECR